MKRIGITGGIGSGKSCVSAILQRYGIPVYDCDSNAKTLMGSDISLQAALNSVSGTDMFPLGKLDRERMAAFVFASAGNAAAVNGIVHPAVKADFERWCSGLEVSGCELCAVESAILFGSGLEECVDCVVMVDAPEEVRLERAVKRDSSTREKIAERMRSQTCADELRRSADFVVDNSGDEATLEANVTELLNNIRSIKIG